MIRRIRDIIISEDPPLDKQSLWVKPNDKSVHHDKVFYKFFHYVNGDWREVISSFGPDISKEKQKYWDNKQDKLIPGSGIKIVNNVISTTGGGGGGGVLYLFEDGINGFNVTSEDGNTQFVNVNPKNKDLVHYECDDTARNILGSDWRMPTKEEFEELFANCTYQYIPTYGRNYVPGMLLTSKVNGKSIFFPIGGYKQTSGDAIDLTRGHYWTADLYQSSEGSAWSWNFLMMQTADFVCGSQPREFGLLIRPVSGTKGVDLGLPSGLKWAELNITNSGFTVSHNQEGDVYGDYFAWGEYESKFHYEQSNYKYYDFSNFKYTKYTSEDGKKTLVLDSDTIDEIMLYASVATKKYVDSNINETKNYVYSLSNRNNAYDNLKGIYHVKKDEDLLNLNSPNMIYVIEYSHDIGTETWDIPDGCIIRFEGGCISGGTLNGNNTQIDAVTNNGLLCNITGTWNIESWKPEWFKDPNAALAQNPKGYYWNDALQKCIDIAGTTNIPMELTDKEYKLYNYERQAPNNDEPDCYDSLLNICDNLTIFSNNKSKIDVIGVSQHRGTYYVSVFGHRYEGTSEYGPYRNKSWNNITFRGIVIDNTHDVLLEEPADATDKGRIINKYCIYIYNACNLTIENCDFYCGGSNAIYCDVAYKRGSITQIVGHAENCKIHNCYIYMKTKEKKYDLSGLFIAIDNTDISNCVIEHNWEDEIQDKWGCGGIELHAGNFNIHNNLIKGYNNGLNVCGYVGDPHGYQTITNNKFDNCPAVLALWGVGEEKMCPCNGVRFINNTCTKVRQPIRQNQSAKAIIDIIVKNNIFDCMPSAGGAISFGNIEKGVQMDIINNTFKNCAASPFFEFQTANVTTETTTVNVIGNTFMNAFGPETSTTNTFFYFVPKNENSKLYVTDNTFEILDDIKQPPIFAKHSNVIIKNQYFTKNISILEYEYNYSNGLKKDLPSYIDCSNHHKAGEVWLDEYILYRNPQKISDVDGTEDMAATSNPISLEASSVTYVADGTKYWHVVAEHPEYFRVGDCIEIYEGTGVRHRCLIASICGDKIYFCGNAESQKSWTGTLTMKIVDYKTRSKFKKLKVFAGGPENEKPTNPEIGCNYYCTDTKKNLTYNGTEWAE